MFHNRRGFGSRVFHGQVPARGFFYFGKRAFLAATLLLVALFWGFGSLPAVRAASGQPAPLANPGVDCQPVTFTDDPDPVAETGTITYTVHMKNNSSIVGDNVTGGQLTITVPTGFTYLGHTTDHGTCSYVGDNPSDGTGDYLQCTGIDLGPLEVAIVTMDVQAPVGTGTYTSTATTTCTGDVNSANDSENNQTTVRKGADIQLTKTVNPTSVADSGIVTYTIQLDNGGPRPAPDLEFHDTLPVGVVFYADDADPAADDDSLWTCSASGQVVTCTYDENAGGEFADGDTMIFHFRAKADAGANGYFTNNADVGIIAPPFDPTLDPDPNNNTSQATLEITPGSDLSITKTVTPDPVLGGTTATFTLHVENLGPRDVSNVTVTDTLPAGYTVTNITAPAGWTCPTPPITGTVTCTKALMADGEAGDIVLDVDVPNVTSIENHTNTATISPDNPPDPITDNNTASVTYEVKPSAPDLVLQKDKAPNPVAVGGAITNTIHVRNDGPVAASAPIVVQDHLSGLEDFDSAPTGAPWDCSYDAGTHIVTCTLVDAGLNPIGLAAGASAPDLEIHTIAQSNGPITNTATVTDGANADFNGTNNTDQATVNGTNENADIQVSKTVDDTNLDATETTLTFTITITNNGPDPAGDVSFDDEVPFYMPPGAGRPETPITVINDGGGTCSVSSGTVSCEWANLNVGQTVTMQYTVERPMKDGTHINDVCAYSGTVGDLQRGNNCAAAAAVTVQPIADVEVTQKTASFFDDGSGKVLAGTNVVYTIQVRNNGPSTAANVTLDDVFSGEPAPVPPFTFLSASVTGGGTCSFNGTDTVSCTLGDMAVDQVKTVTVEVRPDHIVPEPTPWHLDNTATVSTTTDESTTTNNSQSKSLLIKGGLVDVSIEKNESPDFVEPIGYDPGGGGNRYIVYEVSVHNYGPSYATSVVVTDRVDMVSPKDGSESLRFVGDTANSDGSGASLDWCSAPSPNPFPVDDSDNNHEPVVTCTFPDLAPNADATRYLVFEVLESPHPVQGDVYHNEAHVAVAENELDNSNNDEDENTTVRVYSDIAVTKSGPAGAVDIYEPFNLTITVTNYGPGIAPNARLTDNLPAGMVLTGTPTAVSDWGDPVSCNGNAGDTSFTCILGHVDYDTSHTPVRETITITVPVMVTDPNTTSYDNTACASSEAPEKDPDPHPNCGTTTVTMNPPLKLGDKVWYDQNQNGLQDAGDWPGLDLVEVTLYNTPDCSGSPYQPVSGFTNPVTTGHGAWPAGYYEFYPLPQGTYCVKFEVPTAVLDHPILSPRDQGSNDALDSDAVEDAPGVYRITNITLTTADDMTNDVGVYEVGSIGDRVWCESPTNVNDTFDPGDGDVGLNDVTVELYEDFDCDGAADSATPIGSMATYTNLGADGYYQFTNLQVALPLTNQTCYVVKVDTTTLPADCSLPDTPDDAELNVNDNSSLNLTTHAADTDTADFAFRKADFGDLPESGSGTFPTTLGNNGPYHLLDQDLYLGACADAETNGAPDDPDAGMVTGGDDGTLSTDRVGTCAPGADDEDGIEFVTPFIPGQRACIRVTAHNGTGHDINLYGWADWNGDGQFQTGERLSGGDFGSGAASIGTGDTTRQYCFDVPASATFANGDIHFRFRLTTESLSAGAFDGPASNGEVEDYWLPLACVGNMLWNDGTPPVNSQQDTGEPGIAGIPVRLVYAGPNDAIDTAPGDATAQDDDVIVATTTTDTNGRYAFCGIAPPSQAGQSYTFQVQVPPYVGLKSVVKDAAGDQVDSDAAPANALGTGWVADAFEVAPAFTAGSGPAYLTIDGNPPPTGESGLEDGNSQGAVTYIDERTDWTRDFGFIEYKDYGDLPDTFGTLEASRGPWHRVTPNLYLGTCVDVEVDGQPGPRAGAGGSTGDDSNVGFDTVGTCAAAGNDEDGLLSAISPAPPGGTACFQVAAYNNTGTDARLYVWIDWNGDGQFQSSEQLSGGDFAAGYATVPNGTVPSSPLTLCFTMPSASALVFDGGEVHSRLRLTTEDLAARPGGYELWEGPAADGEVEDYWAPLACVGNYLWLDTGTDANLQDSGDSPFANVNVRLVWAGPDGDIDTRPDDASARDDDVILATTTTDASGRYMFCGLAPGAATAYVYQVQVPGMPGYYSVTKGVGTNPALDSDATPGDTLLGGWAGDSFGLQVDYTAAPGYIRKDGNLMPTSEGGNEDAYSEGHDNNFPDARTDWTQDLGFIKYDDYGDLPASFEGGTPAVHPLRPDLYLGGCVDADGANAPDAEAGMDGVGGDDNTAGAYTVGTCATPNDDEDGVELVTPLIPGYPACVRVTATNGTGGDAYLYAWFDWNGDGTFDAGEQVNTGDFGGGSYAFSGSLSNQELCFNVPSGATFDGGEVHYRFRLTTQSDLASATGPATDGEVEDYWLRLACVGNYVWNDSTGTAQDQQDASDTGLRGVDVTLHWDGNSDGDFADAADRTYTVTTDTNGRYDFCGLVPGHYQVGVTTPPSGLPEAVAPNAAADDRDSDGVQATSGGPSVAPDFTITDVTALPTGETGNQDLGAAGGPNNFPDNQVNETIDFGFRPTMLDYGDAPDSYGTSSGTGGPTHVITPDLYLGACVDAELDAATPLDTTGDDANAGYYTTGTCTTPGDDEDGVQLVTPLVPGSQACVKVDAHNGTGGTAYLYAWFDWNGDGDFNDTGEQVNTVDFSGGSYAFTGNLSGQELCFTVPTDATFQGGAVVMRFRLTTNNALAGPTGPAPDGEVEDYREPLYCAGNFVWNDGGSATFAVQDGTEPGISGVTVTLHWDGNDDGDFADAADRTYTVTTDTNGFYTFCGLVADATRDGNADAYRIEVTPPTGLTIVPANQGGNEALDSDADPATGQGPTFTLPPTPDSDTAGNDTDPNGYPDAQTHLAVDFGLVAYDFGDLPAPYNTTLADGGPRHTILPTNNPTLGSAVDPETDGQPDAAARGDDNADTDDEDGVTLPATFVAGHTYSIGCTVSNATAGTTKLSAWFDWNGDGDFADPGEQVLNNADATSACPFNVTVPLDVASQVGVRFRIANETISGPDGALGSGEVEDYLVAGQLTYDYGDLPDGFKTLGASGGPKHQLNAGLYLGACVDGETDAAPDPDAGVLNDGDDATAGTVTVGTCATPGDDEDGVQLITPLLPGAEACVEVDAVNTLGTAYLYAWFDWNGDGQFDASERVDTGAFSGGRVTITGTVTDAKYCFTVPSTATFDGGEVHYRFRLTTNNLDADDWGGVATDGEVEDYWTPLACVGNYVWNDTASTSINAQDASDQPLENITVELTTPGRDGTLGTADDVTVTTTTDAQGRYTFCGLTPGTQGQLRISTLPAGLNQVVVPNATADDRDSDATQPGGLGSPAEIPVFTVPGLADLAANNWTTGEAGNEDNSTQTNPALVPGYEDGRTNLSLDFGFRKVNSQATKTAVATDQAFTDAQKVAIGEIVTYETTLTLSPGTVNNLTLTDVLDQGLAFVACDSITVTGSLTASAGAWDAICSNPTVSEYPAGSTEPVDQGRKVTWTFGTVTNSGVDDATITVRYRAVVLDSADNTRGQTLDNQATWTWDAGSEGVSADPVTVVEPTLVVTKEFDPVVAGPNELVTVILRVAHTAESNADTFDVVLTDPLPDGLAFIDGSLTHVSGLAPTTLTYDPVTRTVTATWDDFPLGSTSEIRFQVDLTVLDNVRVNNEATLTWTSLPCDPCGNDFSLSSYNRLARERNYDPPTGGYVSRAQAEIYWMLPETGFAPGRVTPLPEQPAHLQYQATDMWLEIPKLGIKIPVVGVPRNQQGWNLTWLGANAGWLENTTFPTWKGNSVITAHVTLPTGEPGPFAALHTLTWGDQVLIHYQGQVYVYEVRDRALVAPTDTSAVAPTDYPTLTLVTCADWSEEQGRFLRRWVVKAVLVEVRSP